MSIWSAQKSGNLVFFSLIFPCYSSGNIRFVYWLELPRQGDSNKYTKRMIHKKLFKSIRYLRFRRVHIKFLYNSKFDLTAKSLVTNSVVITRVLCIIHARLLGSVKVNITPPGAATLSYLYARRRRVVYGRVLRPSVRPAVRTSVCPDVRLSVR